MNQGQNPPVEVGEEFEVTIEAVGEKGDGIAKKDGFVLFVPDTRKGERLKIRVTKVLRSVGFAEVVERLGEEAPQEEEPRPEELEDVEEEKPVNTEDFGENLEEEEK